MSKSNFISVNDYELSIDETLALMFLFDGYEYRDTIKSYFGIIEFAKARNLKLENEDLQNALNKFRQDWGLERAQNFQEWCFQKKVSKNALLLFSQIQAYQESIKRSFTNDEVETAFLDFQKDETLYCLFCLTLSNKKEAETIQSNIISKKTTFAEAIQMHGDEEAKSTGGFIGAIPCIEMPEEYSKNVCLASIGDIIGPLENDGEWSIFYLQNIIVPTFDDCEKQVRELLFNEGLKYFSDRTVVMDAN